MEEPELCQTGPYSPPLAPFNAVLSSAWSVANGSRGLTLAGPKMAHAPAFRRHFATRPVLSLSSFLSSPRRVSPALRRSLYLLLFPLHQPNFCPELFKLSKTQLCLCKPKFAKINAYMTEASPHKRRLKCDTNTSPRRLMTHLLHQMVHHRTILRGNGQRSATIARITTHTHTTI